MVREEEARDCGKHRTIPTEVPQADPLAVQLAHLDDSFRVYAEISMEKSIGEIRERVVRQECLLESLTERFAEHRSESSQRFNEHNSENKETTGEILRSLNLLSKQFDKYCSESTSKLDSLTERFNGYASESSRKFNECDRKIDQNRTFIISANAIISFIIFLLTLFAAGSLFRSSFADLFKTLPQ